MSEQSAQSRGMRKTRRGVVSSKSGDKSIVVIVEGRRQHPLYGKVMKLRRKFHVHDENNEAAPGDTVVISECRPMSRLKRWRLLRVENGARTAGAAE